MRSIQKAGTVARYNQGKVIVGNYGRASLLQVGHERITSYTQYMKTLNPPGFGK